MAGQPIIRAQKALLEKVGEDRVFEDVLCGMSVHKLLQRYQVGRRAFYGWLEDGEGRKDRYTAVRKRYADLLAEETVEIADETTDAADAQVSKLRIDARRWMAARINPEQWSEQRGPLVQVSIGDQHVEAMRDLMKDMPVIEGHIIPDDVIEDE
jgi:transposase